MRIRRALRWVACSCSRVDAHFPQFGPKHGEDCSQIAESTRAGRCNLRALGKGEVTEYKGWLLALAMSVITRCTTELSRWNALPKLSRSMKERSRKPATSFRKPAGSSTRSCHPIMVLTDKQPVSLVRQDRLEPASSMSSVSPLPGGPIMIRLCRHAAASVIARLADSCPRTSKS